MSQQLQLTCPQCSAKLNVVRPAAETASARCGSCGHTFTFRVPKPVAPVPQSATVAAAASPPPSQPPAPSTAATDLFGGLTDINAPAAPQAPPRPRVVLPAPAPPRSPKRPARGKKSSRLAPLMIIAGSVLLLLGAGGVATWLIFGGGSIVPSSLSVFDSHQAIIADANASDLKLQQLVQSIEGGVVSEETQTEASEVARDSMLLIARAVTVAPIRESEAESLVDPDAAAEAESTSGLFEIKALPAGALSEEEMDAMRDKLEKIPFEKRRSMPMILGIAFKRSEFVREYLRYGHLVVPEPVAEGEKLAARQIELLRKANVIGAKVARKITSKTVDGPPDEQEAIAFLNDTYRPYLDDISSLAKQMSELAEQRFKVPAEQSGNEKQYHEILYYTRVVHSQMFGNAGGFAKDKGIEMYGPISELAKATREVTAAAEGKMPARLAEIEAEKNRQQAEAARQEKERQDRIAADRRKQEREINEQKRQAEQQRQTEADQLAANQQAKRRSEAGMAGSESPAGGRFGSGRLGSSRFGSGRARRPGQPPADFGPDYGRRPEFGSRPQFGPRPPFGSSGPPTTTPDGGVTITMEDAGTLDTSLIAKKFGKPLGAGTSVSIRNGDLTIRLDYKGSLDEVIKLIDFGKVISKDDQARTIVLEAN